ncbi:MAG: hypothetical protein PUB70_05605 [Bacteroidales bacterium]|nr:hypothetical protein [Bacteroidales bacterium]
MKSSKLLALSAITLLGFSACQKPELESELTSGATHTVTFVAGAPETKTTVDISDGATAIFAWTKADENRFTVYENGTAATETIGVLGEDGKMTLSATFDGTTPASPSYQALYNTAVSSTQTANDLYDETADVLVSAVLNDIDREAVSYFSFKRESAIAKMTLKGLTDGSFLSSVTINSDKAIAGTYELANGSFGSTSNTITITSFSEITGGEATVWFASVPVEDATFTVTATAVDNDENVVATYTKTFSKTITLTRGDVKGFGVAMEKDAKSTYVLFEGETIVEGDYIIVSNTTAMVASDSDINDRLDYGTVEITNSAISSSLQQLEWHIAPSATEGYWTIFNSKANAYASSTGAKNKAQLLSNGTDDMALWSCTKTTGESTYDFINKKNSTENVNSTLRYNSGYGFACYATGTGKPLQLYKKDARTPLEAPNSLSVSDMTISWSPVEGAVGYRVVVGTVTKDVDEASYTFTGEADYYDVSVIALADENSETNRDSNAATLTAAKFGTPTLSTPEITAGVIEETSVAFSWTKDARATNGYHWALYNGEILVKEATETSATSAEVTDLVFGTTYTAKVYAIGVDGEKPYAQSETASIDLKTKAKTTISTIVGAGTGTTVYAIADLTVMAVSGSYYVVKDETGLMFCYNSGAAAGDVVTLEGTFVEYQGLKEFKHTVYTKTSTATIDHGTATKLNSSNAAAYVENPVVQYVKANATVAADGSLKVGDVALYQYGNSLASYAGRTINLYGYTLGYNTERSNIVLLQTSVEIDQTVPYLSVDPTSKTWASDEIEAAVFTVITNTEGEKDWSVTSKNLDWATFAVDKTAGTITVTPKDKNTTDTPREATLTVTHATGNLSETITLTQKAAGAPADVIETIDFESASTAYTFWTFTNMTSQQTGSITAKGGTYYGTTGGKTTASITTKNAIATPKSITFFVSKQTNNTTSSSWKLQVSSNNSTWTDVKTQSATSMSKGSWVEVTQDLSSYSNVYVRVYYTGTTAVRNIDDLSLTYSN